MTTMWNVVVFCAVLYCIYCPGAECRGGSPKCPNPVNCYMDPCDGKVCVSDPSLTCRPDYCHGGCDFYWVDANGKKQVCDIGGPAGK